MPAGAPASYEDVDLYDDASQPSRAPPAAETRDEDEELYQDAGADGDAENELYQDTSQTAQQEAYTDDDFYQV